MMEEEQLAFYQVSHIDRKTARRLSRKVLRPRPPPIPVVTGQTMTDGGMAEAIRSLKKQLAVVNSLLKICCDPEGLNIKEACGLQLALKGASSVRTEAPADEGEYMDEDANGNIPSANNALREIQEEEGGTPLLVTMRQVGSDEAQCAYGAAGLGMVFEFPSAFSGGLCLGNLAHELGHVAGLGTDAHTNDPSDPMFTPQEGEPYILLGDGGPDNPSANWCSKVAALLRRLMKR